MSTFAATIKADLRRAQGDIAPWLPDRCTLSLNDGATVLAANVPCLVGKPQDLGGGAALASRLQAEPSATVWFPVGTGCPAGAQVDVAGGGSFWATMASNRRTQTLLEDVPAVDLRHVATLTLEYLDASGAAVSRGGQRVVLTYTPGVVVGGGTDPGAAAARWDGSLVRPAPFAVALGDRFLLPDGPQGRVVSQPHTVNGLTSADWAAEQGTV